MVKKDVVSICWAEPSRSLSTGCLDLLTPLLLYLGNRTKENFMYTTQFPGCLFIPV